MTFFDWQQEFNVKVPEVRFGKRPVFTVLDCPAIWTTMMNKAVSFLQMAELDAGGRAIQLDTSVKSDLRISHHVWKGR